MNALSILPRVRAWLGSRLPSRRWRIAGGVSVVLVVALLIASLFILRQQQLAASASVSATACASSATTVSMVPPGVTIPVKIPAGEPRVVATVNGYPLCAVGLELRVQGTLVNNRKMLQQLQTMQPPPPPGSSMAGLLAMVKETPNQVRHDALTHMIQDRLLLQEGRRLGLTASLSAAQAMARQTMQRLSSLPPTDPSRITFESYLRANHLTEQTYPTDPRILQGDVETLTMVAVRQYIVKGLPPGESPQAGINAYIQHLWQAGDVRVYLPAKLGW